LSVPRTVYEEVKKRCWFGGEGCTDNIARKDILSYEVSSWMLTTNAEGGCNDALKNSLEDIEILRVPKDISADEAMLFNSTLSD